MRDTPGRATLTPMNIATPKQRVIVDAAIDGSVIRGTLTAPSGERRDFHGWLELTTALEALLDTGADYAPTDGPGREQRTARPWGGPEQTT